MLIMEFWVVRPVTQKRLETPWSPLQKMNNTYLVSVILKSINGAYADTAALLNYGFDNFQRVKAHTPSALAPTAGLPFGKGLGLWTETPYVFKRGRRTCVCHTSHRDGYEVSEHIFTDNKKSGRTPTDHDHLQLQWSSRRNCQILSAITAFRSFLTAASPVSSGGGTHVFP